MEDIGHSPLFHFWFVSHAWGKNGELPG